MKVLLLGEFSGFFLNLKKGLTANGVDVVLAGAEDGWKKISGQDMSIMRGPGKNVFQRLINWNLKVYQNRREFSGYDVVFLVSPEVFPPLISNRMISFLKKNNKSVYVSICGGCFSLYDSWKTKKLDYYIFDNNPDSIKKYSGKGLKSRILRKREEFVYNKVDGIIPIMYEYAIGVKERQNICPTIPLPFDFSNIHYSKNVVDGKVKIMHGIIREKAKGTEIILNALNRIEQKYKDRVEVIVDGKMPLNDYLKKLSEVNVLVDQCKEHCYGMNALYAMSEGRIVLGGASENSLKELHLDSCPVIHIEPNADMIFEKLDMLLNNLESFEKRGLDSREFVEKNHNSYEIAKKYISLWKTNLGG